MRMAGSREILPLLVVISALNFAPSMMGPMIPLLIDQLSPSGTTAASAGLVFALIGLVAAVSAFVAGRVVKRVPLKQILIFSCVGTGLLYLPPMLARNLGQLVPLIAATAAIVASLLLRNAIAPYVVGSSVLAAVAVVGVATALRRAWPDRDADAAAKDSQAQVTTLLQK